MPSPSAIPDQSSIAHIAIVGGGLAGAMTAASLALQLPAHIRLTQIAAGPTPEQDLFYGTVTAPGAYAFNLAAGVTEPMLVLNSDATFSFGTRFENWAGRERSWTQCFHLALPILDGVQFHQFLARLGIEALEPYLVSAVAATHGAFAHPPEAKDHPLSRAEFGYHFAPSTHAGLFEASLAPGRVTRLASRVKSVEAGDDGITALHLDDGSTVDADLYIDCSGPQAVLLSALGASFAGARQLAACLSTIPVDRIGPPARRLVSAGYGWQAETPLNGCIARMTVFDPAAEDKALSAHGGAPDCRAETTTGRRDRAWIGNCVGVGHAAGVLEPLTPAPMMVLQRDIERLLSLVPVSPDMSVERQEYNRRHADDHDHAALFNNAFFALPSLPDGNYWRAAAAGATEERLARKIEQFASRGALVSYDLEPFNPEDWTILHYGLGHLPERHDRLADRVDEASIRQSLSNLQGTIARMAASMPPHDTYMAGFVRFLKQRQG